jgi:hypothetical protein
MSVPNFVFIALIAPKEAELKAQSYRVAIGQSVPSPLDRGAAGGAVSGSFARVAHFRRKGSRLIQTHKKALHDQGIPPSRKT